MKRWILACLAASALSAFAAGLPPRQTIRTADGPRTYYVVEPPAKGPRPLVVLLHGHGGSGKQALTLGPLSAWNAISAREGVLVAALDGVKGPDGHPGWNDGRSGAAGNPRTDDVAFVQGVIARLVASGQADPHRVYLMGMSNGAMMALRLAQQLEPAPAAFCAVCGLMASGNLFAALKPRPVPALLIEGTADPLVPFEGGQVHFFKSPRGGVLSADQTLAYWLKANGLDHANPTMTTFPHREPSGATKAVKSVWGEGQVEFIRVEGGGHAEPTLDYAYRALYRAFTGTQNRDFESAEEAWAFFRDKRLKDERLK